MLFKNLFKYICLILLFNGALNAQTSDVTTFIMVRHAEKELDAGKDPNLTKIGIERTEDLVRTLQNVNIDAVYSTPYNRTKKTALPVAKSKGLSLNIHTELSLDGLKKFIDELEVKHKGQTILLSSHSNVIPMMLKIVKKEDFDPKKIKFINDNVYDDIFIVSFIQREKATITNIKYGKISIPKK